MMINNKQTLFHTTTCAIVFLVAAVAVVALYVDLYSISTTATAAYNKNININISKAILSICSTRTNLSYPAICGPIDDKWFGVRVLSVGLALEFNTEVYPLLMHDLQPGIEQRMRLSAAVSYHRTFKMDLTKATSYAAREQRTGLREVSAALDEVSERFVSRPQIVRFVTDSMYNAFWGAAENNDNNNIKPETWAFVTRVLNSLKKEWLLQAEEALDNVRAGLSRREAYDDNDGVFSNGGGGDNNNNKQSLVKSSATLYDRMVSLASNVLVLRSPPDQARNAGSTASSSTTTATSSSSGFFYYYYEPLLSDKWITFIAEMVVLSGSVRVLALMA
jgi:hypothetical protein